VPGQCTRLAIATIAVANSDSRHFLEVCPPPPQLLTLTDVVIMMMMMTTMMMMFSGQPADPGLPQERRALPGPAGRAPAAGKGAPHKASDLLFVIVPHGMRNRPSDGCHTDANHTMCDLSVESHRPAVLRSFPHHRVEGAHIAAS
jgi:hypothetical protein